MKHLIGWLLLFSISNAQSQNIGIGTTTPQAYGHGGINRLLEIKNDAATGGDIQSHLILSTIGTSGSLGTVTWVATNITGLEKRSALIANVFETANATRLAFYTRAEVGSIAERFSITGNGNVGIGTSTPGFPLSFPNTPGDKISLYGNNGNHYGFGIQGGLLQMYSDAAVSDIAFGFGASNNFTERMRIMNNGGYDGMSLNGRLIIKNGSGDLVGGGAGVWLYKADNTSLLGFMGTQNNQNIGFYGGSAGWGFTYDAINSRVGIGNNNPNAPLAFPAALGKKITLYPGTTGDVGFGVAGNRLQIYSDNPNADVAIGYDAAGTFNERFAVKPNGALALSGNTGNAGQILSSNGSASATTWIDNPVSTMYSQTEEIAATNSITLLSSPQQSGVVPGLSKTIVLTKTSKVVVQFQVVAYSISCAFCGVTTFDMYILLDGGNSGYIRHYADNGASITASGMRIFTLGPGTHTIDIWGFNLTGPALQLAITPFTVYPSFLFLEVIPQN